MIENLQREVRALKAKILDGKAIAAEVKKELRTAADRAAARGARPRLAVVLAGADPASLTYAQAKKKQAESVGMEMELFHLAAAVSEKEVTALIRRLNADARAHGVMVELPLPAGINARTVAAAIEPDKDVDGVHPINRGRLMNGEPGLYPATPQSCIALLKRSGVPLAGRHAVIIGRGDTVGKPLVFLLLRENATVTVCHSQTPELSRLTRQADILVAAAGRAGLVTREMVQPGAAVVDAGLSQTEDGMRGDVDFAGVSETAGWISPSPGGVGALTTALLFANVLQAMEKNTFKNR
ncbi:MAG: bifunctional 5,10-methylenetetrahydrofolate dehydrogenase/5,10-methenyltetrahydrofolate cyclohydrolase [Gracilibacteraceae bacterium]|jgi:methylenetetrahydrofolate dehydrogenase (NADP+)/methenyltetrahydrofolate cyclohydrolase|nr:bifunctional 5,10-methylenetetrahydrofolate dehydrogenase/5,10-methenyltetrahydrofolate cyclohydrolase [Gracilibacteraceae bacterium]